MNNILGNAKRSLLNKRWIRKVFVYGLLVLTSNLISGASFGVGYRYGEYSTYDIRLESFNSGIEIKFDQLTIDDVVKAGYFYRYSTRESVFVKCFSCGEILSAKPDVTCEDLRNKHKYDCLYMNDESQDVLVASLENTALGDGLAAQQPPSAPISLPQPSVIQNKQNHLSVSTVGYDPSLMADRSAYKTPPVPLANDDERPDLSPLNKLLNTYAPSKSLAEVTRVPLSTESSNEGLLEASGGEGGEGGENIYENIYQKMYITKNKPTRYHTDCWNRLHAELKAVSPLELGVSFDLRDNDLSFPVVVNKEPASLMCNFEAVEKLINIYFSKSPRFLYLSLMMEMDRKLLATISKVNDSQHIKLTRAFADAPLFDVKKQYRKVEGNALLRDMIDERGKVIDQDKLNAFDVGVLLYMAPRRVLLENTVSVVELTDLIHELSLMFCKKSMLRRLRSSLRISEFEQFEYDRDGNLGVKTTVNCNHKSILEEKELSFIVAQHVCIFYMWELWGLLKNGHSIPEYVDPKVALKSISMENIKLFIIEATQSLFSCSIKELQAKIDKNKYEVRDSAITKEYADNYIKKVVEQIKSHFSLNCERDDYFRSIFIGSEDLLASTNKVFSSNDDICIICLDSPESGKTEMVKFSSCIHSMGKDCWDQYEENHRKGLWPERPIKCPLCREEVKNCVEYMYMGAEEEYRRYKEPVIMVSDAPYLTQARAPVSAATVPLD
ncbi:MAG: hypothetical protein QS721_00740 [Candidatus Endonucleobacter sp. (ex Gigantidas childressi)]|nr:hypothetical protein [Candidatus Endonucleobacter sp. (ex Gigantidas childressi)]